MGKCSGKTVGNLSCLRYLEPGLVALVLLVGIHAVPSFFSTPNKAKEASAKSVLKWMNQEQQRYYAQHGVFLEASRHLKVYQQISGDDKPLYHYFTRRIGGRVYSYAEPIKEYEFGRFFIFPWNRFVGLKRYMGVVLVSDRKTKTTQSGICYIPSLDARVTLTQRYGSLSCQLSSD